ncbi:MAG: hypothetical protein RBU25_03020 [Lentisphaeria bacterium]|jgi:hypothetical protein|nr:hypothetical protein [Lentisphaeria bacterium]
MTQILVACAIVAVGMLLAFTLVRLAANLVILAVMLFGFLVVIRNVTQGTWASWPEIILGSLLCGFVAALLSLPALPFSSFYKKK